MSACTHARKMKCWSYLSIHTWHTIVLLLYGSQTNNSCAFVWMYASAAWWAPKEYIYTNAHELFICVNRTKEVLMYVKYECSDLINISSCVHVCMPTFLCYVEIHWWMGNVCAQVIYGKEGTYIKIGFQKQDGTRTEFDLKRWERKWQTDNDCVCVVQCETSKM